MHACCKHEWMNEWMNEQSNEYVTQELIGNTRIFCNFCHTVNARCISLNSVQSYKEKERDNSEFKEKRKIK